MFIEGMEYAEMLRRLNEMRDTIDTLTDWVQRMWPEALNRHINALNINTLAAAVAADRLRPVAQAEPMALTHADAGGYPAGATINPTGLVTRPGRFIPVAGPTFEMNANQDAAAHQAELVEAQFAYDPVPRQPVLAGGVCENCGQIHTYPTVAG